MLDKTKLVEDNKALDTVTQPGWPKNCDYPTWWGYLPYRDETVEKLDREYFAARPK